MDRVIRTTVNLLLAVSVTIQSSAACAFQNCCISDDTSRIACQGCGCCTVETPGETCSCCSKQHDRQDTDASEKADCCDHIKTTGSSEGDIPLVEDLTELCVVPPQVESLSDTIRFLSTCSCLKQPDPLSEPSPRSPIDELRDLNSFGYPYCVASAIAVRSPGGSRFDVAHASLLPHLTQIVLCVWLL